MFNTKKQVDGAETYNSFPTVRWGETQATFIPVGAPLPRDAPVTAALVFAFAGKQILVADIVGRGWCIPSGRMEQGETPEQTIRREAFEEAGAALSHLQLLGHYLLRKAEDRSESLAPVYAAEVAELGALPPGTESRGVRLLTFEELPAYYYLWDPLIAAVFHYALKSREEDQANPFITR